MDGDMRLERTQVEHRFAEALEVSGLLAEVAEDRRQVVLCALRLRRSELVQGESLCGEGETATSFWLVTRGQVAVSGSEPNRSVFVERRGPGDLIGELAAMRPGSRRSATVTALDHQTEVYCFNMRAIAGLPLEDRLGIWQGLAIHTAAKLAATVPARTSAFLIGEAREDLLRRFVNKDALGHIRLDGREIYERREAVIMFTDLVGFSAMADKATPEEVAASVRAAMAAQVSVIEDHGGYVDKLMGDGLMAYWLPESDAPSERRRVANMAMDAAVATEDAVAGVLHPVTNLPLRARVGVHIGPVHYGNFGSEHRWAVTLIGQPVNLAARIESAKPTGTDGTMYGPLRASSTMAELLDERHLTALPDMATVQVKTDVVTFIHRKPE